MKHAPIIKAALAGAISLALSQPALAVTDDQFEELQARFNQLADQVEQNSQAAASSSTHLGGYGEMHYNNWNSSKNPDKKEIDLHRVVLMVNHEFNDSIRLFTEIEIEHAFSAGDGSSSGEVEVEQAFIQFDLNENYKANAGVFLIPVGIINETHEPPTFYGVERNPVEKNIIPATWWEGGAMLSGNYDNGISFDVAVTSGLDGGTNIRGGRQKASKAKANDLATTARVKYTGISGLTVAGTVQYQGDMTQESGDGVGSAFMYETHAIWNIADFTLTGLYANWTIDGSAAKAESKNLQDGGYVEASYKVLPKLGVFARQNQWSNGGSSNTRKTQTKVGFSYWPHEDVVLKADYQAQNDNAGDFDGFNLGVGYQF
jgi:hypothetical protein